MFYMHATSPLQGQVQDRVQPCLGGRRIGFRLLSPLASGSFRGRLKVRGVRFAVQSLHKSNTVISSTSPINTSKMMESRYLLLLFIGRHRGCFLNVHYSSLESRIVQFTDSSAREANQSSPSDLVFSV